MGHLKLGILGASVALVLGLGATGIWLSNRLSSVQLPKETKNQQPSPVASSSLSEIPMIPFCDLLAHPTNFQQRVIRTEAYLFSLDNDLHISDPESCVLPHPMVGVELDPSFQVDTSNRAEKEVYDLIRAKGERKYAKFHVVIVGRFEGPIFAERRLRDKRTGKYEFKGAYKYPYRFTITRVERAEAVPSEEGGSMKP